VNENNLIYIAVVSVLLGVFKSELGKIFTALGVYLRRQYKPGDKVLIQCGATGAWGLFTIEKYVFSLFSDVRGVYITHPDEGPERIPLVEWAFMRTRPAV